MKRDLTLTLDLHMGTEELPRDTWVLSPKGSIDSNTSEIFKNRLTGFLSDKSPASNVLLDMTGVKYISSVGLGALIGLFKRTKEQGSAFGLYNPQLAVQRVLEISKLDFLLVKPGADGGVPEPFSDYVRRAEERLAAQKKP